MTRDAPNVPETNTKSNYLKKNKTGYSYGLPIGIAGLPYQKNQGIGYRGVNNLSAREKAYVFRSVLFF